MMDTMAGYGEEGVDSKHWAKRLRLRVPLLSPTQATSMFYRYLTPKLLQMHRQASTASAGLQRRGSMQPNVKGSTGRRNSSIDLPRKQELSGTWEQRHVWHDVVVFRLRDVVTQNYDYVVLQTDATATKAAEEELRRLRRQQRALLHRLLPEHVATALLGDRRYTSYRSRTSDAGGLSALSETTSEVTVSVRRAGFEFGQQAVDSLGGLAGARSRTIDHGAPPIITVATETNQSVSSQDHAWKVAAMEVESISSSFTSKTSTPFLNTQKHPLDKQHGGEKGPQLAAQSVQHVPHTTGGTAPVGADQTDTDPISQDTLQNINGRTLAADKSTHSPPASTPPPYVAPDGTGLLSTAATALDQPLAPATSMLAQYHPWAAVLYADIKGFTKMSQGLRPRQVMRMLNRLYTGLDKQLTPFGVHKVETIGDCYVACAGLQLGRHAGQNGQQYGRMQPERQILLFALELIAVAAQVHVNMRVGLHVGPVMSGVVGLRMPRFCLLGKTMAEADSVQSAGLAGRIVASATFADALPGCTWDVLDAGDAEGVKDGIGVYLYSGGA